MRVTLIVIAMLVTLTACTDYSHTRNVWNSCRDRGTNEIGCAVVGFGAALADPWIGSRN